MLSNRTHRLIRLFSTTLTPSSIALSEKSFGQFNLLPSTQLAVLNSGILVPTAAQTYAIPKLRGGDNVLLISQTGRGKTLAYLIPLVEKLLRSDRNELFPVSNKPRGIVLVPTRELVVQVTDVIRKTFGRSITSVGLAPGLLSYVKEKRIISDPGIDIIVATPARLHVHLRHGLSLKECAMFVVDEADTLCDTKVEMEIREIVMKLNTECQVAIVGATRTAAVNSFVNSLAGRLRLAPTVTNDAHMTVPHVEQVFVPVGRRKRTSILSEIVSGDQIRKGSKILVFVNSVRTCNFLSRFIAESPDTFPGVSATSFHGSIPPKIRTANYKKFTTNPDVNVLVCTNLASRGIDLDGIDHVVMYDFPDTLADYLHRAGRTARAGKQGKVTAFYTNKNLVLANQIQHAARAGKPIEYKDAPRQRTKISKYRLSLDELKRMAVGSRNVSIRGLRTKLGLPPHSGIGSAGKKREAKNWEEEQKSKKELHFLQKRKRLGKHERLPRLPNRAVDASDSRTQSRIVLDGDIQMVPVSREVGRSQRPRKKFF
jgi:superfamily II DNA/RNA helicase